MAERIKFTANVDEDVAEDFRTWVEENTGGIYGNLGREVEKALLAHMDRDPLSEVNSRLDRIEEKITASSGGGDTFGDMDQTEQTIPDEEDAAADDEDLSSLDRLKRDAEQSRKGSTPSKLLAIVRDLRGMDDSLVRESDLEDIISRHAGSSDPTLRAYKKRLQDRKLVLPNPDPENQRTLSTWVTNPEQYARQVESLSEISPYSRESCRAKYGERWYNSHVPDTFVEEDEDGNLRFKAKPRDIVL